MLSWSYFRIQRRNGLALTHTEQRAIHPSKDPTRRTIKVNIQQNFRFHLPCGHPHRFFLPQSRPPPSRTSRWFVLLSDRLMSRFDRIVTLALPLSASRPPISIPPLSLINSALLFFSAQTSPRRPFLSPCLLLRRLIPHILSTPRPCRKRRLSRPLGILLLLYPRPRPKSLPCPRVAIETRPVHWSPTSLHRHQPITLNQRAPPDPDRDKRASGLPPLSYGRPQFDSQTLSTTSRELRQSRFPTPFRALKRICV
ncbi:hypothetical protein BDV26DRAFT_84343 [Aspergillus bertholletiae]|uniref:Uncharacterized protein n=1 Tax=Aspergillus bertholletiae TaxID=1226010 RepID=A0A5N7BHW9_9EURO|nr:hypothetical protein BDV26DRAFT_84343 [Aspergillus bertholletiae]